MTCHCVTPISSGRLREVAALHRLELHCTFKSSGAHNQNPWVVLLSEPCPLGGEQDFPNAPLTVQANGAEAWRFHSGALPPRRLSTPPNMSRTRGSQAEASCPPSPLPWNKHGGARPPHAEMRMHTSSTTASGNPSGAQAANGRHFCPRPLLALQPSCCLVHDT